MSALPQCDPILLAQLRADLEQASFFAEDVHAFLGASAEHLEAGYRMPAVLAWENHRDCPLKTLTGLFLLGLELPVEELTVALPRLGVNGLKQLGLARIDGETARARVHLHPHRAVTDLTGLTVEGSSRRPHWWLVSDLSAAVTGRALRRDHVLGVGGATTTLALATPRPTVETALDLGTGCGVLALYLAQHCERVVATDISARACAFARFNVALNEAAVEVREGDLFEPVSGETFDLITSNPPFVITAPDLREDGLVQYRDGGRHGDELTAVVAVGIADHLAAGGVAVMLGNWEVQGDGGQRWWEHSQRWLTGTDVAAWVVQRQYLQPAEYVRMWLRDNAAPGQLVGESQWRSWLTDFAVRSVVGVGLGLIVMEKSGGDVEGTWQPRKQFDEVVTSSSASGSYLWQVVRCIAAGTHLVHRESRLLRAEDVREERHYLPGSVDPQVIIATQGGGFGQRIRLTSEAAGVLGASDGELTVGQITTAIASLTGIDVEEVFSRARNELQAMVLAGMLHAAP